MDFYLRIVWAEVMTKIFNMAYMLVNYMPEYPPSMLQLAHCERHPLNDVGPYGMPN